MHNIIDEEAAAWFARRRDGTCAPSEEAAFDNWRGRSEAHARAYAETERAWQEWKQLQASGRMREMTAAAMAATAPRRSRAFAGRRWRPLLAVACVVAVVIVGVIQLLPLLPAPPVTYSAGLGERRAELLPVP